NPVSQAFVATTAGLSSKVQLLQQLVVHRGEFATALVPPRSLSLPHLLALETLQILGAQQKHLTVAFLRIKPDRRQARKFMLENRAAAADFADERAAIGQMGARFEDDAPDDVDPVAPAMMRKARLGGEFRWKG